MTLFEQALANTVGKEGDYSDNPADRGGQTRYGITIAVARAYGYDGPMESLPWVVAAAIYRMLYWDTLRLDLVGEQSPALALKLFDAAVNCGVGTVARWLQRALAVQDGVDVAVDGSVGPGTLNALAAFLQKRKMDGETVLLRIVNGLQCVDYLGIAEADPKQGAFIFGWVLRRVQ